jgi:hypothetical protein
VSKHRHIIDTFRSATPSERTRGELWYHTARLSALELTALSGHGPREPWSVDQAACVIAALSPQNKWSRNLEDAQAVARWYASPEPVSERTPPATATYDWCRDRALQAATDSRDPWAALGDGRKTKDFARLIANPNQPYVVCIDRHAYRIFRGEAPGDTRVSKSDYRAARLAYFDAAEQINREHGFSLASPLLACQIQSITWLAYRRQHGITREETK